MNSNIPAPAGRINVAIGKPATQSSLSPWSTENDAAGAVTGAMPADFGFHTAEEPAPWWRVDLLESYWIDRIVLHNRRDTCQERARSMVVDVSEDGASWRLIHAGTVYFTDGEYGALTLPLAGKIRARHVRVSLAEPNALHLAQVAVFVVDGEEIRRKTGLDRLRLIGEAPHPNMHHDYALEGPAGAGDDAGITGFRITPYGRFGNQLRQIVNAVWLAKRLNVKCIAVPRNGLIQLPAPFSRDGIAFVADPLEVRNAGAWLIGNFFYRNDLSPLLNEVDGAASYRVAQDFVLPGLMRPLPNGDVKHADELSVHFRAGDIFGQGDIHRLYVQPPLAFYTFLIRRLMGERRITRVRLVYEDKGNPCVDGLIGFLESAGIAYRAQSSSLAEDLAALVDAPLLAFGFGTFGIGVALLSRRIETVFFFEGSNSNEYEGIPSVARIVMVRDSTGGYIKPGEWENTPAQRQLMLDYPEAGLEMAL